MKFNVHYTEKIVWLREPRKWLMSTNRHGSILNKKVNVYDNQRLLVGFAVVMLPSYDGKPNTTVG